MRTVVLDTNVLLSDPNSLLAYPDAAVFTRADQKDHELWVDPGTALAQNGANTLTLSGINSFGGGVTVNNGALRTANLNALGSGSTMTVNSGGTLVLGAVHTNSFVLAGGTLGTAVTLNPTPMSITAAAGTTSTMSSAASNTRSFAIHRRPSTSVTDRLVAMRTTPCASPSRRPRVATTARGASWISPSPLRKGWGSPGGGWSAAWSSS